jgi:hypothetical protein
MDHMGFLKLTLNQQQLTPDAVADVESSLTHLRGMLAAPADKRPEGSLMDDAEAEAKVRKSLREQLDLSPESAPPADNTSAPAATAGAPSPAPELPLGVQIELYECKLSALTRNAPRLEGCIASLEQQKAEPRVVLGFKWSLAAVSRSEAMLASVVDEARRLGINDKAIEALKASYGTFSTATTLPAGEAPGTAASAVVPVATAGAVTQGGATSQRGLWALGLLGLGAVAAFFVLRQQRRARSRGLVS